MPTTTMVVTSQTIEIDQISDIAVTSIAHDDVAGDYYREIVFFGAVPEIPEGTLTPIVGSTPETLRVKIRAATVEPLKISVPADEF
jgi:hypothetical protein